MRPHHRNKFTVRSYRDKENQACVAFTRRLHEVLNVTAECAEPVNAYCNTLIAYYRSITLATR